MPLASTGKGNFAKFTLGKLRVSPDRALRASDIPNGKAFTAFIAGRGGEGAVSVRALYYKNSDGEVLLVNDGRTDRKFVRINHLEERTFLDLRAAEIECSLREVTPPWGF